MVPQSLLLLHAVGLMQALKNCSSTMLLLNINLTTSTATNLTCVRINGSTCYVLYVPAVTVQSDKHNPLLT